MNKMDKPLKKRLNQLVSTNLDIYLASQTTKVKSILDTKLSKDDEPKLIRLLTNYIDLALQLRPLEITVEIEGKIYKDLYLFDTYETTGKNILVLKSDKIIKIKASIECENIHSPFKEKITQQNNDNIFVVPIKEEKRGIYIVCFEGMGISNIYLPIIIDKSKESLLEKLMNSTYRHIIKSMLLCLSVKKIKIPKIIILYILKMNSRYDLNNAEIELIKVF